LRLASVILPSWDEAFGMDLQFGQYRLRRRERKVLGPQGPVELSARSFDILALLLERPDEVIAKAELFEAVWPGLVGEENTLQVHISALRRALDTGMIATVHGRGYKYAGPRPEANTGPATISQATVTDYKPVVVLPFENLSSDPDQQFFSDGITGDITNLLARFRVFAVIGQHSAAAFRSAAPDFAEIRERPKAACAAPVSLSASPSGSPMPPVRKLSGPSITYPSTLVWRIRRHRGLRGRPLR
jgi:DNA-binding winged helix-turn-helix (wHTH) protein